MYSGRSITHPRPSHRRHAVQVAFSNALPHGPLHQKIDWFLFFSLALNKNLNINFEIPNNLNKAIEISKKNNPDLIIAKLEYEQSEKDVKIAKSDLSPSATLSLESSKTEDLSSTYDERDKEIITATISWPIFQGGKNSASLKRSKNLKNRKKLLFYNALKTNEAVVASAWSNFLSNQSLLAVSYTHLTLPTNREV